MAATAPDAGDAPTTAAPASSPADSQVRLPGQGAPARPDSMGQQFTSAIQGETFTPAPTTPQQPAAGQQGGPAVAGASAAAPSQPYPAAQPAWGQSVSPRPAIDWKALTPGLLRLLAAITLAMTALGNWWVAEGDWYEVTNQPATHHSVFPLIGCIAVALAAVAQIALLPQFLGAAVQPIIRFAIRAALCLPALVAIVIALVTTLGGPDSDKASATGVTMLGMAVGFALVGLDDAREALPADIMRWISVAVAGLGIALSVLSMIQFMGTDANSGKEKWLVWICSVLFIALVGALVAWIAVARPPFGHGLLVALAGAVALSLATRGWISADINLTGVAWVRQGHGAALIALALALATAHEVSTRGRETTTDDASVARRLTQWVIQGFAVAAVAALFNALAFIGGRTDDTPGGQTWFLVLMFITALVYAACAWLLKSNPMGRLIAVISAVTMPLTILITMAASTTSGSMCEAFTEGAYLWLPLAAAGALTIPPAVRRIAGPIAPQTRQPVPQAGPAQPQQWNNAQHNQNGQV